MARVAVVGLRLGATLAASELAPVAESWMTWCSVEPVTDLEGLSSCPARGQWAFLRSQAVEWGVLRELIRFGLGG